MPGPKDWLRKARADLKLATKSIGDNETIDPAVYLTHQCAEKSLKTFFVFLGMIVPKTHLLDLLLDECTKIDTEFMWLRSECKFLDPYGTDSRYPNDIFRVNHEDLIDALEKANRVHDFVRKKILKDKVNQ
jgi:HEPN domain-containing protein